MSYVYLEELDLSIVQGAHNDGTQATLVSIIHDAKITNKEAKKIARIAVDLREETNSNNTNRLAHETIPGN